MICEVCHKEQATVFLTEIVNGKKIEMHMCNSCATKEKSRMYTEDSFQQFLSSLLKLTESETLKEQKSQEICNNCQMTIDEFRKKSKLGCANCYETFKPYIKHIVKSIHGGELHIGKKPFRMNQKVQKQEQKIFLESELRISLMQEDYEEAARIRDLLAKFKEDDYE